jgi:hypothetical protein
MPSPNPRVQRTRHPLGRAALLLWLLAIPMSRPAQASPATRLILSNDQCLAGPCPATHPTWPTWVVAGSPFDLVILAVDDLGAPDDTFTGTVSFSSSDPLADLPSNYTFTPTDGGRKILPSAVLRSLGGQRIAIADVSGSLQPSSFGLSVYQVGTCASNPTTLCLSDNRFQVDVRWRRLADLSSSTATAVTLTADTGYFWFFGESNIEIVVKVLDACAVNEHFWVFAGGLTNVEVFLTVVDSHTGTVYPRATQAGAAFPPIQETVAFECP